MRRMWSVALVLAGAFLFAPTARAQFTTVTATVKDPNGIPYAGAVLNAVLVPGASGGYRLGGQPYSGQIGPVTLDSTGKFTVNFGDVTLITPGSPQWQITVDSAAATIQGPLGTGAQSFTYTSSGTTISGSSPVSLTTALNAIAPALTNISLGPGSVTTVSCGNLTNVFNCSVATPTTTPALSFSAVTTGPVLDCSQQAGADMGAKLNACIAALPASGGVADATKFSSPQTISTAVVDNKAAVIQTCGIAITQTANISLTAVNAGWHGCQDQSTIITKGANIDQITMSANYTAVDFVTLAGASGSFTGNGITENNASSTYVANNTISNEAGEGLLLTGTTFYCQIIGNDFSGFVTHAIQGTGTGGFECWINHNKIDDTATATGSTIELTETVFLTENEISNTHGFLAVHNTNSNTNMSVYSNNFLQSNGTGASVISVAGFDAIHHNVIYNTGAHAAVIGGTFITDNVIVPANAGADVIDAPTSLRPVITGNQITFVVTGVAGFCAININGATGWEGGYVGNNVISYSGTGSGADYGVCLTTTAAQFGDDMVVENNDILASTGGGTGSAGVFFNNTAGITTNGSNNIFRSNQCIVINVCVARTDAQNLQNYYENNAGPVSSSLFSAGGSTNDVVILNLGNNGTGTTFANLPTAGNGSQIYTTDATCTNPATAGGTGCLLTRMRGVWTGIPLTGNCSSSASPAVCGVLSAGSVVIAAAATTVTVNTTAVTANSQILLAADDTLGTKLGVTCNSTLATLIGGLAITARTAGTSFQITSGATPAVNPLCISYFIVN